MRFHSTPVNSISPRILLGWQIGRFLPEKERISELIYEKRGGGREGGAVNDLNRVYQTRVPSNSVSVSPVELQANVVDRAFPFKMIELPGSERAHRGRLDSSANESRE